MGVVIRSLLVRGNEKLSPGVHHFDVPPIRTCPGRSKLCQKHCYATKGRYVFPQVIERLEWNYAQSKRSDFVDLMVDELYRKGVLLMRWHCAGDIYSPAYARKMLEVIGRSPHCTFWFYTRSWRIPTIFPLLKAISFMPNAHVWFSCDAETGYPAEVPERVRIAWMVTEEEENTERAELLFLLPSLRKRPIALPMFATVCPTELPEGKAKGTTCATCGFCWHV
jgi:hypothetical protein